MLEQVGRKFDMTLKLVLVDRDRFYEVLWETVRLVASKIRARASWSIRAAAGDTSTGTRGGACQQE
jgi:hypothetical protein